MLHSTGHGTSTPFWVSAFEASDTATPSLTSRAAWARLASVMRLSVPSSSSLPQRPQLVSSVCQRSYSALVMSGREDVLCGAGAWDHRDVLSVMDRISPEPMTVSVRMLPPDSDRAARSYSVRLKSAVAA